MDFLPVFPVEPSKVTTENTLINITITENQSMKVIDWLIQNRISFSCGQKQSKEQTNELKSATVSNTTNQTKISIKEEKIIAVIKTIYGQITGHISTRIPSVAEIAAEFQVDAVKFNAIFKKMYLMPFHHYFTKYKMSQARQLLESGDFSVNQISEMLGYTTPTKFVVTFKKYQNVTPGVLKTLARSQQNH